MMNPALRRMTLLVGAASLLPWIRRPLEAHMAVHMLLHLPCVALLGAWSVSEWPALARRWYAALDWLGAASFTFAVLVFSLWMIPVALDASVLSGWVGLAKYLSVFVAGAVLRSAWPRSPPVLSLFMLGNLAWMLATAGMLFQQAESRLCVSYLVDQQSLTGTGLIGWAVVVGIVALTRWRALEPTEDLAL
jgi:hypothetical protein